MKTRLGGLRSERSVGGNSTRLQFFWGGARRASTLPQLDDSGSSLNPPKAHFVLDGVACLKRQAHWVDEGWERLTHDAAPEGVAPRKVESHASSPVRGRETPWKGVAKSRIAISKRILEVLARANSGVIAFARAGHDASLPGQNPVELAFEELSDRLFMDSRASRWCSPPAMLPMPPFAGINMETLPCRASSPTGLTPKAPKSMVWCTSKAPSPLAGACPAWRGRCSEVRQHP